MAADTAIGNDGIVNGLEALRCSECDGCVTCKRGYGAPHFQHRPHHAAEGRRRHTPR